MIELNEVGAFPTVLSEDALDVRFGIYLPGIHPQDGYDVQVRVIHEDDRFNPDIPSHPFHLAPLAGSPNNLWQANVTIPLEPGTSFGKPGTYLYRYQLLQQLAGSQAAKIVTMWFTDPFARSTDEVGQLSTFSVSMPEMNPSFTWQDDQWKTPALEDLVIYEMHVEEFNRTFDGVIERLTYLKSLGVTCLELMPVTSLKLDFDWGYGPLHYFAACERWGGPDGLKRLINACHNVGVAVILDVVYQHVDPSFPYHLVYADTGRPAESPMVGGYGPFGPDIDFNKPFAQEYIRAAHFRWLHEYHVDGFRYDEVTDLYDGPTGNKYAKLAYDTYNESLTLARFTPSGMAKPGEYSRIIQVPEALNRPQQILRETYSNSTWQNGLLNKAQDMARWDYVDEPFAHLLDASFMGYPANKTVHDAAGQPVDMPVAPLQYLESHDHSQLISFLGLEAGDVPFGDRSKSYKLQPFAIALYTSQGTPMLWQGQEFAENYVLPNDGNGRIRLRRDVNWEYFYDQHGQILIRLYRILGRLRHKFPALRSQESFYYNIQSRPWDGLVAYRRQSTQAHQVAMVFLNFSDAPQSIALPFPEPGAYREMIDDGVRKVPLEIVVASAGQVIDVQNVPSNYGYIFVK